MIRRALISPSASAASISQSASPRSSRTRRWLVAALVALVCAGVNVWRTAYWKTHGVYSPLDSEPARDAATGEVSYRAHTYARVEILKQHWRPLTLTLRLRAGEDAGAEGSPVRISADYMLLGTVHVGRDWSTHTFRVTGPASRDGTLTLQMERLSLPGGAYGFAFNGIESRPVLAVKPVLAAAVIGAGFGLFAWWLAIAAPSTVRSTPTDRRPRPSTRQLVVIGGALFVYFAAWAVIRPPFQTGDEPQHLTRATSVLRNPWVTDPGRIDRDPRFINPLTVSEPPATAKLPFRPHNEIAIAEIAEVKRIGWRSPEQLGDLPPLERAISSYATGYYLPLFAIAEPLVDLLRLSPYDATYVYRLVTCAFSAVLWTLVFIALTQTPETAPLRWTLLLVIIANPMVAYLSSGVTADAPSNPLSALAILAFWRAVTCGTHTRATVGWLVAGALVKPAALPLMASLVAGGVVLWLRDRRVHAGPALVAVARAGLISLAGFYLWSTPRFRGTGPVVDTLSRFVSIRLRDVGFTWTEYWGKLGWLDCEVRPVWYALVFGVVLLNLACVAVKRRRSPEKSTTEQHRLDAFLLFAVVTSAAFVAGTVAGEFYYLPQAGYTLQGRYLLPVAVLVAAIVAWHEVRPARYAFIGVVMVLCALLVQRTVDRYYAENWSGVRAGLPFVARPNVAP
jgi:hypothetical protein